MPRKKKDPFRVELSRLTGKLAAYYALDDVVSARYWASELQSFLIRMGLLIDNGAEVNHNGPQFKNATKTKTETTR